MAASSGSFAQATLSPMVSPPVDLIEVSRNKPEAVPSSQMKRVPLLSM